MKTSTKKSVVAMKSNVKEGTSRPSVTAIDKVRKYVSKVNDYRKLDSNKLSSRYTY